MLKVMIVDDDRSVTSLLGQLLELDGFEVMIVPLGKEAFNKANEFQPDVFLVDYHLADIPGVELIRQLRSSSRFAETPIVMASGRDVEKEAMEAGANLFRIKPYDPAELEERFQELAG